MGLKYIENTGKNVIFVGGKLIPPGDGREVDELLLPPELKDAAPPAVESGAPSVAEQVAELLRGSVKAIKEQLAGLSGEALDLVDTIEGGAETPRVSLLAAVKAERIKRAADRMDGDDEAFAAAVEDAYQKQLAALTPEQLEALGEQGHAQLREQAELDVKADTEHPPVV